MIIRLGYVAITNCLDITSSSSMTFKEFSKSNNYLKLDRVIKSNLIDLLKILEYNKRNNIHFYRLTSKLIPLATHKEVEFEYIKKYKKYYQNIASIINNNDMRIDLHPDQFTVLNSTKKEVIESSIINLIYHYDILEIFNIINKVIILHIGSSVFGKDNSLKRFINSFNKLDSYLKESIAIENDDKVYNIVDTLNLCKTLNVPMVLDYHHHKCNSNNIDLSQYLKDILDTWNNKGTNPKMHFSSPKNKKEFRSHNDYVDVLEFIKFLDILKKHNRDVDIMLEAKAKDDALFRLIRQLKYYTNYRFIDETTFEIKK